MQIRRKFNKYFWLIFYSYLLRLMAFKNLRTVVFMLIRYNKICIWIFFYHIPLPTFDAPRKWPSQALFPLFSSSNALWMTRALIIFVEELVYMKSRRKFNLVDVVRLQQSHSALQFQGAYLSMVQCILVWLNLFLFPRSSAPHTGVD